MGPAPRPRPRRGSGCPPLRSTLRPSTKPRRNEMAVSPDFVGFVPPSGLATDASAAVTTGRAQREGQPTGVALVLAAGGDQVGERRRGSRDCLVDGRRGDVVEREVVRSERDSATLVASATSPRTHRTRACRGRGRRRTSDPTRRRRVGSVQSTWVRMWPVRAADGAGLVPCGPCATKTSAAIGRVCRMHATGRAELVVDCEDRVACARHRHRRARGRSRG